MEGDVPRPSAWRQRGVAVRHVLQRSGANIEPVEHDPIETEVRRERESIRWVGHDAVRVRRLLPLGVGPVAAVLIDARRRREAAAPGDREESNAPAIVVRDENSAARSIDTDVAW